MMARAAAGEEPKQDPGSGAVALATPRVMRFRSSSAARRRPRGYTARGPLLGLLVMHRSRLVLLLLLLALGQHGALLHQLDHAYYSAGAEQPTLRQDPRLPDGTVCLSCLAYAQLSSPISGTHVAFAAAPAGFIPAPAPRATILRAHAPTPRSRGPPHS